MGLLEHIVIKTLKPAWEIMECFLEEEAFQLILKRYKSQLDQGPTNLFYKEPDNKYLDPQVSATATHFCCCRSKAAMDNPETKRCSCVPIELYLQKQKMGQIWPLGHSVSTTDLHEGKRKATRGKSSSKGVEMGKNMENQKRANNVVFLLPGAQKEASVFTKDMCWHTG